MGRSSALRKYFSDCIWTQRGPAYIRLYTVVYNIQVLVYLTVEVTRKPLLLCTSTMI